MLVITGARQTGKSTLASMAFPDYPVVNLDSPIERATYERMTPEEWIVRFPRAIIDEAQKLPSIFETVKACYDRDPQVRYLMLGSSQILLMKKIRESLAGRVALRELYPFSLPELLLEEPGLGPALSRLIHILKHDNPALGMSEVFLPDYFLTGRTSRALFKWKQYLNFGGMPAVQSEEFTDQDRFEWLEDFQKTFLERDLIDLYRFNQLEPFVRLQKAAALRTANLVNYSELARLSSISPPTAKQFIRYLEVSYQIVWLPAWYRNAEKRLAKQPKLHFLDPGIRRAILSKRGDSDGAEFESAVIGEIIKQCKNERLPVEFHCLRTVDGREVDLLIEREDGFIAVECKQTERVSSADFRHFHKLAEILDKPLLLGLLVSNDAGFGQFETSGFWNMHVAGLLS